MDKAAILVRVSTVDQSHSRQISELTAFASEHKLDVVEVLTETVSGAKQNAERKSIQRLFQLATANKINKVLIHEVSRLGRDTAQVLATLETLHKHGVSIMVMNYNLQTLNPDNTVNPMAQFLFTILADIARMERITLVTRVRSGLEEARRNGKILGRPKNSTKEKTKMLAEYKQVVKYLNDGYTIREAAKLCDVGKSTVQRVKKLMDQDVLTVS